ncbi:MAG: lipid-A-disaccharide synthase [Cyanobacteria bacterium J06614_10]
MASAMTTEQTQLAASPAPLDIVILANGPGEVATWVKPVVRSLRSQIPESAPTHRISVMLSPCPHASGQEPVILNSYPEVDRVQSASHFFRFLLTGKTQDGWAWHPQGVVVFLGGDQLYTVLVAKRLGYRTVTYAEWDARWPHLIDSFGVMQAGIISKAPEKYRHKFTVVGDLMADVQTIANRAEFATALDSASDDFDLIGFLPGSKPAKLEMGVPMLLAIAQILHIHAPHLTYVIGVAPNLTHRDLLRYADPAINPAVSLLNAPAFTLVEPKDGLPYWQIEKGPNQSGPKIYLWQRFPALDLYSQCKLCFTTVGANTAQLGALAIPMIVLLPTQRLGALQLADGWPGLVSRLPGVGGLVRKVINPLIIKALQKSGKRFAWPNIWAKREVVPELFGPITAEDASQVALDYLAHPEKLTQTRQTLRQLRGPAGAAEKMARLILETVNYPK